MKKKYPDGSFYEGDSVSVGLFKRIRQGYGKLTYSNGDVYEGNWKNDLCNGKGRLTKKNGDIYDCEWMDGHMTKGTVSFANGDSYNGGFSKSGFDGYGSYTCKALSSHYTGYFSRGKKYGPGTETTPEYTYKGRFAGGHFCNDGRIEYKNGDWLEGHFYIGQFIHGKGKRTEKDGSIYTGEYQNGVYGGIGELILPDGKRYYGGFSEGKYHGHGKLETADKELIYKGDFEEGFAIGEDAPVELRRDSGTETKKASGSKTKKTVSTAGTSTKTTKKTASTASASTKTTKKTASTAGASTKTATKKSASLQTSSVNQTEAKAPKKSSAASASNASLKKLFSDLENDVEELVIAAKSNKKRVEDPPIAYGAPEISAKIARQNAAEAWKIHSRIEERAKREEMWDGALKQNAAKDLRSTYYNDGKYVECLYTGQLSYDGKYHGYGRLSVPDYGITVEGEFDRSNLNGYAKVTYPNRTDYGDFKNNKPSEYCVSIHNDGVSVAGKLENGKTVSGVITLPKENCRYEGDLKNNSMSGCGIYTSPIGEQGFNYVDGNICGYGYYKKKEETFFGKYYDEKKYGVGVIQSLSGTLYYGEVKNFLCHGKGRYITADGDTVIGHFKNGNLDGYCIFIHKDGARAYFKYKDGDTIEKITL